MASQRCIMRHTLPTYIRKYPSAAALSPLRCYCYPGHDFLALLFHEQQRRFQAKAGTINLTPVNGINRSESEAQNEHL